MVSLQDDRLRVCVCVCSQGGVGGGTTRRDILKRVFLSGGEGVSRPVGMIQISPLGF